MLERVRVDRINLERLANFSRHQEIAKALTQSVSIHTVKNHVTNILKKLDVSDRVQLMAKVIQIQTKMMQ